MEYPNCPKCGKPMNHEFEVTKPYLIPEGTSEPPPKTVARRAFRCPACNVNVTVDDKGNTTVDPSSS